MCVKTEAAGTPGKSVSAAAAGERATRVVLKFGSSVLTGTDDLKDVVTEIYRHVRHGRKVVAVASAFAGETDALIGEAEALGARASSPHAPRLIALGEERSAALLAIACEASGLDARIAGAREIGLVAGGPVTDAHPESIDAGALNEALDAHEVVITPGFIAIGSSGEQVLLGRGGSDLTAVVIAKALGLDAAALIKDVDGVYDRDPAAGGANRYATLSYDRARLVAGQLLQPKAIDAAAASSVAIDVAALGAVSGTRVGAVADAPALTKVTAPTKVAVAGLGVIGEGAALRVLDNDAFSLTGALVRDASKPRNDAIERGLIGDDAGTLLDAGPAIIIDALSDGGAGRTLIESALSRGISVVSANKQAVAGVLAPLHRLANENHAHLAYASSVGGGAPMVETLRDAARTGEVVRITGILNGTVNFILDAMTRGASFDAAVKNAQDAGFAEADPSADLSGLDAKAKMSILAYEAFGEEPDEAQMAIEGLDGALATKLANDAGDWRQVARVERKDGAITATLSFERVDGDMLFSSSVGEENVVRAETATGDVFEARGRGAGRAPTVESVMADLWDIRRAMIG
ncbi:MAG: homoserine dehydrogenase [Pseudomonadota bacterium]